MTDYYHYDEKKYTYYDDNNDNNPENTRRTRRHLCPHCGSSRLRPNLQSRIDFISGIGPVKTDCLNCRRQIDGDLIGDDN